MEKSRTGVGGTVDFDVVASSYSGLLNASIRFSGEEDDYFDHYKLECLKRWLWNLKPGARILDFGCGIGKLAGLMAEEFSQCHVHGYDVSTKSIALARENWKGIENLSFGDRTDGEKLYDLVTAANVFHHIWPENRKRVLTWIFGQLGPGGVLVIFEHNPLNPLTRHVVKNCAFDADAELISLGSFIRLAVTCQFQVQQKRYIVFFPKFLKFFRKAEHSLGFLPLGAQYMLVLEGA
jgi:2-polyprenyl-3-methyl-5-hydroxy-6-metoxy-1,4-benzoquinol methylase